jgi:GT2 family glycosyltransferase
MSKPLISIVIPTHNRKRMLDRLLMSTLKSTYKNIEIIVIDDASSDGTFEYIKQKYKKVKIFRNKKNLFTAGSRNTGFKKATGDFVFFIDDDNILDRFAVERMVGEFLKDDSIGELGPVNYSPYNKRKILWARTMRNVWLSKTNQSRSLVEFGNAKIWETADVPNAFMVRTSAVRDNKIFFREKYGIMYEESDYAYRIRQVGFKIMVVRDAKIYHDIENELEGDKGKDYMYHFMEDKRRPYVFARNRIIFHSIFSSRPQFLSIIFIGIWIFVVYYSYKILFYNGIGEFGLLHRIGLVASYLKGTLDGISFVVSGQHLN